MNSFASVENLGTASFLLFLEGFSLPTWNGNPFLRNSVVFRSFYFTWKIGKEKAFSDMGGNFSFASLESMCFPPHTYVVVFMIFICCLSLSLM